MDMSIKKKLHLRLLQRGYVPKEMESVYHKINVERGVLLRITTFH